MGIEKPKAKIRIAVISDLHCRLSTDPTDSFLEVGALRIPPHIHPVQSLFSLVEEKKLRADVLLAPGDLSNRASREGLSQAWDLLLEIGDELGCESTIPVLGNHDVTSRPEGRKQEPFYHARNLRPGFPFRDESAVRAFLSDGFCVRTIGNICQVIAVNTVVDHHDELTAKRGTFDYSRIHRLAESLSHLPDLPLRLAVMHHHPIVHSGQPFPDMEVLPTGDQLMKALREHHVSAVVHGHKHQARLTVVDGVAVLAAGSFSAHLGVYANAMGNLFHIIDLVAEGDRILGQIETYAFHYGSGWGRANYEHLGSRLRQDLEAARR